MTILTGPNNSGKSSLIECLRARGGYQSPSFSVGARNSDIDEVQISYIFDEGTEQIKSVRKGSSETTRSGGPIDKKIFVLPSRRAFSPYFQKVDLTRDTYITSSGLPAQRAQSLSRFEGRLFQTESNEINRNAFDALLGSILGFKPDWSIDQSEQGTYFLKFTTAGKSHSSDGVGEGIISLFAITDALYDSKAEDIVVIDEPELSLHPALQKRLALTLLHYSQDRQIILATHSPYFTDLIALENGAQLTRVQTGGEGTVLHQLGERSLKIIRALASNRYNPHIFGLEARELFFQEDGIVLVEGQEDVLLLPKVADQLNLSIPGSFFGWGAGGADNIAHLCRILTELGFEKVCGVLDGNKAATVAELRLEFPGYFFTCIPAEDIRTKLARPPVGAIEGVLDGGLTVRPEHEDGMRQVLGQLATYLAKRQETVPAEVREPAGLCRTNAEGGEPASVETVSSP